MSEVEVPPHYAGREPAFIKHHFLKGYVERLAFKIASGFEELVYVDGFSGPWKSGTENYEDTSFGIALQCLTSARTKWREITPRPRDVRMTAHLIEENPNAYQELEKIGSRFPEVQVTTHHGDFLKLAPTIAGGIPPQAFTFALIDPKSFKLDMAALRPLLARERTEVVFNFMYDFANRWIDVPELAPVYDHLLPGIDWRLRLGEASSNGPIERKKAFLACFKEVVRSTFGYAYVADVDIQHSSKDRTLYFLVYGTREPTGLEVFRDCQVRALETQAQTAGQRSIKARADAGMDSLFGPQWEPQSVRHRRFLEEEKASAERTLLAIANDTPGLKWGKVWPRLLADHAIRKTDAGRIAGALRKQGQIHFPQWAERKQVPDDSYLLMAGPSSAR